jgi:hypothetical protein
VVPILNTTSVKMASRNMESGIHADERERQEENNCELHLEICGNTTVQQVECNR